MTSATERLLGLNQVAERHARVDLPPFEDAAVIAHLIGQDVAAVILHGSQVGLVIGISRGQSRGQGHLDLVRPFGGSDQGGGGGADVALVLVPDRKRDTDTERVVVLERHESCSLSRLGTHINVRHWRDLCELQAVASPQQGVAGGEDIGVIAKDVCEHRVVVVVGDEPIDLPFDRAQRQLLQPHVSDELLPGIHVVGDSLLVAQPNDEGLRPQGRWLVAGGEPARRAGRTAAGKSRR